MPLSCTRLFFALPTCVVILGLFASAVTAATTFNFRDTQAGPGVDLDGVASGSSTLGNVTLTMTLFPDGAFNQTTSGFGINAVASADDTDEFDAGEGFTFSFDHNVTLDSVAVSLFGTGNSGRLSYDGGSVIGTISATGTTVLNSSVIPGGTVLRFESLVGAFSLDSLTVTAMPEPNAFALFGGAGALGLALLRRMRPRSDQTPKPPSAR